MPGVVRCLVICLGPTGRCETGSASASLLEAIEAVLHQRHRASSAIEGFNATLRPYLYVHKGATKRARAASGTQGFLALFRAWFNLRTRRWGGGRHKGTSAHECLTGQRIHDWLTLLGYPPSPALTITRGRDRALASLDVPTSSTACLGTALLVCVKMNYCILIGARISMRATPKPHRRQGVGRRPRSPRTLDAGPHDDHRR